MYIIINKFTTFLILATAAVMISLIIMNVALFPECGNGGRCAVEISDFISSEDRDEVIISKL